MLIALRRFVVLIFSLSLMSFHVAMAHSGGLNSSGCHNNTSNGTYHCHSDGGTSSSGGSSSSSGGGEIWIAILVGGLIYWAYHKKNHTFALNQGAAQEKRFSLSLQPLSKHRLDGAALTFKYDF